MKLLNFLLHATPSTIAQVFVLPWGSYELQPIQGQQMTVKLTDFGTAEMQVTGSITVGQVVLARFSDCSSQPLKTPLPSICFRLSIHVLSRRISVIWVCLSSTCFFRIPRMFSHPSLLSYEVLLADCLPPSEFTTLLHSFWMRSRSESFAVLRHVLRDDDQAMLPITLYRYLVLWFNPALFSESWFADCGVGMGRLFKCSCGQGYTPC